jgi:hypothetical protein
MVSHHSITGGGNFAFVNDLISDIQGILSLMTSAEYKPGRKFLVRLAHGSELSKSITEFAKDKKIEMATFTIVGALKKAKIAYYNQQKKDYKVIELQGAHEIASCMGNISSHEKKPFIHMHAVLADEHGDAKAGHLLEGVVFAAELHVQELEGPKLERARDQTTGLALWKKSGL